MKKKKTKGGRSWFDPFIKRRIPRKKKTEIKNDILNEFFNWIDDGAANLSDGETQHHVCIKDFCVTHGLNEAIQDWATKESNTRSALDAGIPLSVIQGKTELREHFSQDYIDWKRSKK